jgi:hypothetical protein
MSYGPTPGGEQDPAGQEPPVFGATPTYPGQAGPAGPPGWVPGQQPPPGYGPPAYGQPVYGQPTYGPPGYGMPMYGPPGYSVPGQMPSKYQGWGVAALIGGVMFSLIIGLPTATVGMKYGSKVSRLWNIGDVQGAASASRKARGWLTASTVFDLLGVILLSFLVITSVSGSPVHFNNPSPSSVQVTATAVPAAIQNQLPALSPGCHHHLVGP